MVKQIVNEMLLDINHTGLTYKQNLCELNIVGQIFFGQNDNRRDILDVYYVYYYRELYIKYLGYYGSKEGFKGTNSPPKDLSDLPCLLQFLSLLNVDLIVSLTDTSFKIALTICP